MLKRSVIKLAFCQLAITAAWLVLDDAHAGLDGPHTGANGVGCLSCHQMTSTYPKLLLSLRHTPLPGELLDRSGQIRLDVSVFPGTEVFGPAATLNYSGNGFDYDSSAIADNSGSRIYGDQPADTLCPQQSGYLPVRLPIRMKLSGKRAGMLRDHGILSRETITWRGSQQA